MFLVKGQRCFATAFFLGHFSLTFQSHYKLGMTWSSMQVLTRYKPTCLFFWDQPRLVICCAMESGQPSIIQIIFFCSPVYSQLQTDKSLLLCSMKSYACLFEVSLSIFHIYMNIVKTAAFISFSRRQSCSILITLTVCHDIFSISPFFLFSPRENTVLGFCHGNSVNNIGLIVLSSLDKTGKHWRRDHCGAPERQAIGLINKIYSYAYICPN